MERNKIQKDIRQIIAKTIPSERQVESFLFGSFVRERHFHDIDVGLLGATSHEIVQMREEFEESSFPFKVDVIDFPTDIKFKEKFSKKVLYGLQKEK